MDRQARTWPPPGYDDPPYFCCDGAGQGSVCDPWCDNAEPAEQERFIASQHLGYVDLSIYPYPQQCDDERCCGDIEDGD